jgi:hypothetical protein
MVDTWSSQFRTKHITKLGCPVGVSLNKECPKIQSLVIIFPRRKWLELYIQTWGTRNIPYFWDVPVWVPLKMSYTRSVPSCLSSFPIWDDHMKHGEYTPYPHLHRSPEKVWKCVAYWPCFAPSSKTCSRESCSISTLTKGTRQTIKVWASDIPRKLHLGWCRIL